MKKEFGKEKKNGESEENNFNKNQSV